MMLANPMVPIVIIRHHNTDKGMNAMLSTELTCCIQKRPRTAAQREIAKSEKPVEMKQCRSKNQSPAK